jgi:hypothetical protein
MRWKVVSIVYFGSKNNSKQYNTKQSAMSEDSFGWDENFLEPKEQIISDEIAGANELSLNTHLYKVRS